MLSLTLFIFDITFQCCFVLSIRMGIFFTVLSNDMLALTTTGEHSVPKVDAKYKVDTQ